MATAKKTEKAVFAPQLVFEAVELTEEEKRTSNLFKKISLLQKYFDEVAPTFEEEEDIPAVAWVGMGIFLENKVAIRGYFDAPSTAGLYVQISDDEGNVLGRVTEEDFTTATGPAGTPVTGFLFDGLSVNQMSKVVNITVYNEIDQVVSGTYTYSIESYAYRNQNSSNTILAELVKSMIKYGDAAKAYSA